MQYELVPTKNKVEPKERIPRGLYKRIIDDFLQGKMDKAEVRADIDPPKLVMGLRVNIRRSKARCAAVIKNDKVYLVRL